MPMVYCSERGTAAAPKARQSRYRTTLAAFAIGVLLMLPSCKPASPAGPAPSPVEKPTITGQRSNPPLPPDYFKLADQLSTELLSDRSAQDAELSEPQFLAEINAAILDFQSIRSTDPDIRFLAQEAAEAAAELRQAWLGLLDVPAPPGAVEVFIEGFIRGFIGMPVDTTEIDIAVASITEARVVVRSARRLEAASLLLPRVARKHAGPTVKSGQAVVIDFDEAWGPIGPDDWLTLRNNSNHTLHNVTIDVALRGQSNETCKNIHFLSSWQPGTDVFAEYGNGVEILDKTVFRQTVSRVQEVTVSLWCDELTQEGVRHVYEGEERANDVARYCKNIKLKARYQPFKDGLLFDTHRGVRLLMEGIPFLPQPQITIIFRRGDDVKGWNWDIERWDDGEEITLNTDGKLAWDPDDYTVIVGFPSVGCEQAYKATWKKSDTYDGVPWLRTGGAG